jgi:hypothetical protein
MSGDAIETIELTVTVQANGIIRRADGYILGRCSYDGPTEENSFSRLKNIAQAQASLAEPVTTRAKLMRDAKALIRALKLPVGGGVAWTVAFGWHAMEHECGSHHRWLLPDSCLSNPGEEIWIPLDTPETEASPQPEKGSPK